MTRRCPRDFALTYRVSHGGPDTCVLEWFTAKVIHQVVKDFVPAVAHSPHAWIVLANQFSFPISYLHKARGSGGPASITYNLNDQELQPLIGKSVVEVRYKAHRNIPDGRFDNMSIGLFDILLGIPVVGPGGCFEQFKTALLLEQEP